VYKEGVDLGEQVESFLNSNGAITVDDLRKESPGVDKAIAPDEEAAIRGRER
jgi:hypothetical protein